MRNDNMSTKLANSTKTAIFYSDFMKTILHLCADIGSDSWFYQQNSEYKVILIGKKIEQWNEI